MTLTGPCRFPFPPCHISLFRVYNTPSNGPFQTEPNTCLAVVSDIHSNLEAFQAVLEDIEASEAQAIISLGDNIGYGPNPEEVMHLLKRHKIPSVMGNHELGLTCEETLEWFNPYAERAWTSSRQPPSSLQSPWCHIRALPHLI